MCTYSNKQNILNCITPGSGKASPRATQSSDKILKSLEKSGKETTKFGASTKDALKRFQEAYKAEILTPAGLTTGTGQFSTSTRKFVNSIISK